MPDGGTRTSLSMSTTMLAAFASPGSMFSPGIPPVPPDPQPVRVVDFPAGFNLNWTPRAYEPFGFPALRSFANVELVRLAIETRKDQIERLDWQVKLRANRRKRVDADERIRKVERLFRKPDGVTPFASWLRVLVEDLLAIDAPTVERRFNRNGDLVALDVVDGASIKVLVDETGRRPRAPLSAYQQIIKGRVWCDLTTEQLIYSPRNMRANHLYGFGPVEQIIVTLNTVMRRQTQQLSWFTEGNLPAGLVNVPEGWTPDQVKDWQKWMDARLSGNLAERSKLLWAPAGSKYQGFKESPIKDEFDEWLARVVCFAFSLPPTPFIRQMNRATAQEDQDRALEEGLSPLLVWSKRLFDGIIQDDLGFHDLEFAWDTTRDLDPEKQAKIYDMSLRNGSLAINEVRDDMGLAPVKGGEEPMIYLATGAMPLSLVREAAEKPDDEPQDVSAAPQDPDNKEDDDG